jgi:hypothetical protein
MHAAAAAAAAGGKQRAATLALAPRDTALLSAPRCGVAPGSRGTRVKSGSAAAAAALVTTTWLRRARGARGRAARGAAAWSGASAWAFL